MNDQVPVSEDPPCVSVTRTVAAPAWLSCPGPFPSRFRSATPMLMARLERHHLRRTGQPRDRDQPTQERESEVCKLLKRMVPQVGLEPTTLRLTGQRGASGVQRCHEPHSWGAVSGLGAVRRPRGSWASSLPPGADPPGAGLLQFLVPVAPRRRILSCTREVAA